LGIWVLAKYSASISAFASCQMIQDAHGTPAIDDLEFEGWHLPYRFYKLKLD
jgi:hypothetical protein